MSKQPQKVTLNFGFVIPTEMILKTAMTIPRLLRNYWD